MKYQFPKGSTSIIVPVFIQDSSSTTGAGLGSLDQTSSIVGGYVRPGGTGVALAVDEDVTTEGTYQAPSAVGKVRIGTPANMRTGTYELHLHNDLLATGADAVFITLGGASNMADLIIEIQLTGVDLNDDVRGGMTALPNAAADANGGLVTGDGSVTFTAGVGNRPSVDATAISADVGAADALETMLDGTGGNTLSLGQVNIVASGNDHAIVAAGAGTGDGINTVGGASAGVGIRATGSTTGEGIRATGGANSDGFAVYGVGTGMGLRASAVGSGSDFKGDIDGSIGSLATQAKADVNAEVDSALNTAIPGSPTADSINQRVKAIDDLTQASGNGDLAAMDTKLDDIQGATFSSATDSLEAIRDRGDAAWTTGAGGSDRLLMVDTTIATLASQTSFTLTAGSADDDAYVNCTVVIEDASTAVQKAIGLISAYTGSSKTVTLKYDPGVFVMATGDKIYILAENALKSTDQNRQLDVTATGAAGLDWGNVENKATANDLAGTDMQLCDTVTTLTGHTVQTGDNYGRLGAPAGASVSADVAAVKSDTGAILTDTGTTLPALLPAALVGGKMDSDAVAISGSTAAADNLEASAEVIVIGAAEAGTLSTTQMTTDLTEATNDHYNGRVIIWTSGVLLGQATDITDYAGATGLLTFTAVTEAPSAADTFVIV